MDNISFQYPTWYIIFCVLLGIGFALFLYFRDKTFKEKGNVMNWILGIIRALLITLLSMLLLSPLIKSFITETKKPVVVLAQDLSESITADMSEEQLNKYKADFNALSESLSEEYDLKQYAFGSSVREGIDFNFTDKVSNLSEMLKTLYDLYSNQNLGAVVLATDGIYNEGSNPIYAGTKLAAPIYTIALGDTTAQRDLVVKRVFHNKIAYLGDKFSIQVDIAAQNCAGTSTNLRVTKVTGGSTKEIKQIPISIDKNDFFTTKEIIIDADVSGVQRYRISVNKVADEITTGNNSKEIFVDVLDARQKILILANTPHPDITAIKQSISNNKNYQVTTAYANDPINIAAYDFVVMHQLPSRTNGAEAIMQTLYEKSIPRLYIMGMQSDFSKIGKVQPLVSVNADGKNTNDVQATIAPNFSLFNIDERIPQELPKFAPLLAPFGDFKEDAKSEVLLYQRIGKVDTKFPLLVFGEQNNIKMGILCAEGVWKWRLFDYMQHQNHEIFDEIMAKSIQYLTLKEDKRKFRVSTNKNIFKENEQLYFDAELYNDSYELINEPDASLVITDSESRNFPFTFDKSNKAYTLNAGKLPVGNYSYKGKVMSNGKELTYNGQFSVKPVQLEIYETTADHGLLKLLSDKYGGDLVYPSDLASLGNSIKEKGTIKPTIYQTSKTQSIINKWWIFFLLFGLLTLEWFLRRYFGGY